MIKLTERGFTVLEVILAAALFVIFATGLVTVALQGLDANRLGQEQTIAVQYASEGMEAVRSISNQSFTNLIDSNGEGLTRVNGLWAFRTGTDFFDKYSRSITISDVYRNSGGNIVSNGGTLDPNTKKITSTVTWNFSGNRNDSVVLNSYLTNWRGSINRRGGMIIYQDGGSSTDAVKYKILDSAAQTWSSASALPAVSFGNDRALRVGRLYSSTTRNEKILLSRRFDGATQYIYAQVWNGASWTNQLLSSWNSTNFLDVQNFDGTYLSNGSFIVVYSDNTSVPKYRIWNGGSWSAQNILTNLANNSSGIPLWIVVKARPGTNEVMAVFLDQNNNVNTEYYNGTGWSLHAKHTRFNQASSMELVDFSWSHVNPLQGGLIYIDKKNNKELDIQIWSANGSGGGSWSAPQAIQSTTNLGSGRLESFTLSDNYLACDQDNSLDIKCYTSSNSPAWTTPINNILTTSADSGTQRAFDIGFESLSGDGLAVFSDSTSALKYKLFAPAGNTIDAAPSSLSQSASGPIKTVAVIPNPVTDDIMVLFADSKNHLYSVVWNGTTKSMYTNPSSFAINSQSTNGTSPSSYWYDFAWDGM